MKRKCPEYVAPKRNVKISRMQSPVIKRFLAALLKEEIEQKRMEFQSSAAKQEIVH